MTNHSWFSTISLYVFQPIEADFMQLQELAESDNQLSMSRIILFDSLKEDSLIQALCPC